MYQPGKYKVCDELYKYLQSRKQRNFAEMFEMMQTSKAYEKMVSDMTLGKVMGKSSLSKHKYTA